MSELCPMCGEYLSTGHMCNTSSGIPPVSRSEEITIDLSSRSLRHVIALERIATVLERFYDMKYNTDLVRYEAAKGQIPKRPKPHTTITPKAAGIGKIKIPNIRFWHSRDDLEVDDE